MATSVLDLLPLSLPIKMTRGSRKTVRLTLMNPVTDEPIDLTGKTVRIVIKTDRDESLPVQDSFDADPVDLDGGVVDLTIPEDATLGEDGADVTYQHTIWIVEDFLPWWAGSLTVYATTGLN